MNFIVASAILAVCLLSVMGEHLVTLPQQFYASVGTTIPFTAIEPVAQTGSMYVDAIRRKFRVDTFWMDTSRSIVVDLEQGHCFVLQNHQCRMIKIDNNDRSFSFGVPKGFAVHPERYLVRGVPVTKYSGVEAGDYLMQVDYYMRNMSFVDPRIVPEHEADPIPVAQVPILWRIETRRSRRKEIGAAPIQPPNWRFFGHPMDELVVPEEPFSTSLESISADVPVTVDFFNFVPMQPDPNVFTIPSTCEQHSSSEEFDHDVDVFAAQRLLVDLSFRSVHGIRLMESLWGNNNKPKDTTAAAKDPTASSQEL